MRWLITGATGFKGAWLSAYLKAKGETVVGLCGGVCKMRFVRFNPCTDRRAFVSVDRLTQLEKLLIH